MKTIPLSKGKVAIVDDEDFERLSMWKWHARENRRGGHFYAIRRCEDGYLYMHRDILCLKKHELGDHKNHNTLDNRRENLRVCNQSQNCMNQRKTHGTSKYKGVSWCKARKKWMAHIRKNRVTLYLGIFTDEERAAKAYDKKAIELFGEFACTNASLIPLQL